MPNETVSPQSKELLEAWERMVESTEVRSDRTPQPERAPASVAHQLLKTSSVAETVSDCMSASRRIRSSEMRYSIGMTLTK